MQLITFTTDFGIQDWFVGTMKGVVFAINPRATIIDLTHELPAGDIRGGAFALMASYDFFPQGTVHVAVVDPGVGGARNAIAVQTAEYSFVGPDNGVLSFALAGRKIKSVRRLENEKFFLQPISRTFHGRDIFAPVAAHLSRGVPISRIGPLQKDFVRLPWPTVKTTRTGIEGEIIYVDRFGNAITNIANSSLRLRSSYEVFARGKRLGPVKEFYQAVPAGRTVAVPGSSGFLEIAVNGGSGAKRFGLEIGNRVSVRRPTR